MEIAQALHIGRKRRCPHPSSAILENTAGDQASTCKECGALLATIVGAEERSCLEMKFRLVHLWYA